jgi:hypothetical protein
MSEKTRERERRNSAARLRNLKKQLQAGNIPVLKKFLRGAKELYVAYLTDEELEYIWIPMEEKGDFESTYLNNYKLVEMHKKRVREGFWLGHGNTSLPAEEQARIRQDRARRFIDKAMGVYIKLMQEYSDPVEPDLMRRNRTKKVIDQLEEKRSGEERAISPSRPKSERTTRIDPTKLMNVARKFGGRGPGGKGKMQGELREDLVYKPK